MTALLPALYLLLTTTGCSSYHRVTLHAPAGADALVLFARDGLVPGDRVRLRLRAGCVVEGRLVGADKVALAVVLAAKGMPAGAEFGLAPVPPFCGGAVGDTLQVARDDVAAAERLQGSVTRSILLGLGLSVIALVTAAGIALKAGGGLSSMN